MNSINIILVNTVYVTCFGTANCLVSCTDHPSWVLKQKIYLWHPSNLAPNRGIASIIPSTLFLTELRDRMWQIKSLSWTPLSQEASRVSSPILFEGKQWLFVVYLFSSSNKGMDNFKWCEHRFNYSLCTVILTFCKRYYFELARGLRGFVRVVNQHSNAGEFVNLCLLPSLLKSVLQLSDSSSINSQTCFIYSTVSRKPGPDGHYYPGLVQCN